ncbi:MAG TPA: diol dehydratase small subunit [Spirillospora sp.]|nr:diol dehydratase small subunit [Spirillospora sp.]
MTKPDYPLLKHAPGSVRAASGRSAADLTLQQAVAGELSDEDLRISAETLRAQAQIAREAGYTQLAANLTRAAELTAVPNDELLKMYELLRPGRASYDTLIALAQRLETAYHAAETGRFVRQAAEAYRIRGLLRREA